MQQNICVICGHVHDDELEGIWSSLPEDFVCPECGCGKQEYELVDLE